MELKRPVGGRESFPAAVRKWQLSLSHFQLLLFLKIHCTSFPGNINGILIFTTVPLTIHFGVIFLAFLKCFLKINDCFHLILKVFAQPNSLFLVVLFFKKKYCFKNNDLYHVCGDLPENAPYV